ncbi:MAG: T9SS type A sorting domain-containing protein [Crocinitomicaceae bacterium]|jgi:hypothetical protein|nr:T9SS type A sorting domain-containing protein [Crocinitomicaceae bacterium]
MRFWFLLFLLSNVSFAQELNFENNTDIVFKKNGATLQLPTAGGLNYAQFSDMDIDFDGDLDLVVFDRTSNNVRVFRNIEFGGTRQYELILKSHLLFPPDLAYRLQLYDYDGDGKKDLFTHGIGGLKVYRNTGSQSTGLSWELATPQIRSDYEGDDNNLYVASSDIPALVDVDHDGDMDVLTFNIGGQHLEYHQNQSQELFGHSDSLIFVLKNKCWGGFAEDMNNSSILLNDTSAVCHSSNVSNPELYDVPAKGGAHSGSTVLAIDMNNDQVYDLILGDISSNKMVKLINGGTAVNTNSLMISVEQNFPSNTIPANLEAFPAGYFLDVDFDGIKDLVIGANAKNSSENIASVWYYKNTGSNSSPNFVYQKDNFLQDEMIEVGTASVPVFFDHNNDGKEDLVIANYFHYQSGGNKKSSLTVYRNTSVGANQEFTYIENDYLNLGQENLGIHLMPTFADLTGDGKKEMLLALENGEFRLYTNTSSSGNATFSAPSGPLQNNSGQTINHGTFPNAQLFDLNKDGRIDLIIGKRSGELIYYENTGTTNSPVFTLKNDHLGNVDVSNLFPDGFPVPHFFTKDDTTYLFCGSLEGGLRFYKNIDGHLDSDSSFTLWSHQFLGLDIKGYSSFYVNDIDQDGLLDLWCGMDLGGIYHYEVDPNSNSSLQENEALNFTVFPNPNSGIFYVLSEKSAQLDFELYDLQGQQVAIDVYTNGHQKVISLQKNVSGLYLLNVTDSISGQRKTVKIQISK